MTPIGKLSLATLILGSAFVTAKYLHQVSPEPTFPTPRPEVSRRPLAWQARSIQATAAPGLTAIAQNQSITSESAAALAATKKPTAFNSQVAFAAFSHSNPGATSKGTPPAGESPAETSTETLPPLPSPPLEGEAEVETGVAATRHSTANPQDAVSVLRADVPADPTRSERRWPIPLALSPQSDLSSVQLHEAVPAAATGDFIEYTVQFGDSLPLLASRFLGDREAYLSIYTANLDVLSNPADVAPGLVLKIPARR